MAKHKINGHELNGSPEAIDALIRLLANRANLLCDVEELSDRNAKLSAELESLRKVANDQQNKIAELLASRNEALDQRDALAAHVEFLIKELHGCKFQMLDDGDLKVILESKPTTSLAERDAQVARRAIEWAIPEFGTYVNTEKCSEEFLIEEAEDYAKRYAERVKRGEV